VLSWSKRQIEEESWERRTAKSHIFAYAQRICKFMCTKNGRTPNPYFAAIVHVSYMYYPLFLRFNAFLETLP
jgi:hypothetical protein